MLPYLAALLLAANPVTPGSVNVVVAWKQDQTEVALRKIELTGLKVVEVAGNRAVCRGKQSGATVAVELRHEAEFLYVFADIPCETFVAAWRGAETETAVEFLQSSGAKVLHRGTTLPFAVCRGPLTADIQELCRVAGCIDAVEPGVIPPPPEPKE